MCCVRLPKKSIFNLQWQGRETHISVDYIQKNVLSAVMSTIHHNRKNILLYSLMNDDEHLLLNKK